MLPNICCSQKKNEEKGFNYYYIHETNIISCVSVCVLSDIYFLPLPLKLVLITRDYKSFGRLSIAEPVMQLL